MSFILRGDRETGTITYHCSTTRHALEKLQDFRGAEYRNIKIIKGKNRSISQTKLFSLSETNPGSQTAN